MQFHEQLSALRRAKGISQETLAEQLNVSRQAVSKWETGTAKPELDNILALCRILEVSPNELLGGAVARIHRNTGHGRLPPHHRRLPCRKRETKESRADHPALFRLHHSAASVGNGLSQHNGSRHPS